MLGKSRIAWNTLESLPDLWLWLNGRRMRDRKENDHLSLFFSSSEPFGTWVGFWLAGLPRVIELWIPSSLPKLFYTALPPQKWFVGRNYVVPEDPLGKKFYGSRLQHNSLQCVNGYKKYITIINWLHNRRGWGPTFSQALRKQSPLNVLWRGSRRAGQGSRWGDSFLLALRERDIG